MQGTSRTSLAALEQRLGELVAQQEGREQSTLASVRDMLPGFLGGTESQDLQSLSQDLLAVAALLGREPRLRASLTSTGSDPGARAELVQSLLGSRIGPYALELVRQAVQARWSRPGQLVDSLELLGAEAAFSDAEADGRLDRVEEELFRVARTVTAEPQLRTALSDPAVPGEARQALVRDLIGSRADATTTRLVEHVVVSSRGRRVEAVLEQLVELAASRRSEVVAEVTAAIELSAQQEQRLAAALQRVYGTVVRLQVTVDPTLVGGIVVRVGDEVIDGSVVHRLAAARDAVVR
jgi:F-type H+-transporting ATPase subunit delta